MSTWSSPNAASTCLIIVALLCGSQRLMGQHDRRDLAGEPEMQRMREIGGQAYDRPINQATGITLMNAISALGAITQLYSNLDGRLREELLECRGKCPKLALEYEDLQLSEDSYWKSRGYPPAVPAEPVPRIEAGDEMTYYCFMVSGIPAAKMIKDVPTTPDQQAKYDACLRQIGSLDSVVAAHTAAMGACVSRYKPGVSEFLQQPYDDCMNASDPETQMCSKRRKAIGKTAACMAAIPPRSMLARTLPPATPLDKTAKPLAPAASPCDQSPEACRNFPHDSVATGAGINRPVSSIVEFVERVKELMDAPHQKLLTEAMADRARFEAGPIPRNVQDPQYVQGVTILEKMQKEYSDKCLSSNRADSRSCSAWNGVNQIRSRLSM